MSPPLKILIVGSSIAGPMAAYWLSKTGAEITVIERYPSLRPGGQNIDLRLTGVTVMRKIPGFEDRVRDNLAPEDGVSFVRDDGSVIGVMRASGNAQQQGLVSEFEIFRGDLSRLLVDLTKEHPRVRYVFGEQIASMQEHDDGGPVTVTFTGGRATESYDLIVACDGATSRTRAMAFSCSVREHIIPLGAWVAYFSIPQDYLSGTKIAAGISAPGGRTMAAGANHTGGNQILAWSSHTSIQDPWLERFRTAQKQGTQQLKELVQTRFEGMGWVTAEMLASMSASEDFYASELCQVKIPALSKGRLVLVGDAGYAAGPTGTGTSLALAGAYTLAGEIGRCNGDISAGLAAYEEKMRPIIKDMQSVPPGVLGIMAPQTKLGLWTRNMVFRLLCWGMKVMAPVVAWITGCFAAGFGKDTYGLPEYEWAE